jgi:rSAM/selenodomain-associated transferase 2
MRLMISIIIPTHNEERHLPGCLDAVLSQARTTSAELLIVDGGSADATVEVARGRGIRVSAAPPGRGRQMNAGAREASGSLLVFLAADTRLPAEALAVLCEIDARGELEAGGFQQRFDSRRPFLRAISALHNLRARLTGVIYGDQVPFVRSGLFSRLGGFREDSHLEDIEFGVRLRRVTRPRLLPHTAVTSARRFDRHGDLRATFEAARILAYWILLRRAPQSSIFFDPVRD